MRVGKGVILQHGRQVQMKPRNEPKRPDPEPVELPPEDEAASNIGKKASLVPTVVLSEPTIEPSDIYKEIERLTSKLTLKKR